MKKLILVTTLAMMPCLSQAAPVFSDNFDNDALGLNQHTFLGGWSVIGGSVDLIGEPSFFDLLPGHGRYVDLDGSTNTGGRLDKAISLAGHTKYNLSFDLAGSQRGDSNTVEVIFGTNEQSFTLSSADPFKRYTLSFTTNDAADYQINFHNVDEIVGVNTVHGDNMGALLDNVTVSVATVPEPETYLMMLTGLGIMGFSARRRNKINS